MLASERTQSLSQFREQAVDFIRLAGHEEIDAFVAEQNGALELPAFA